MPRLILTFRRLVGILEANGFEEIRHGAGSHRRFRGVVNGRVELVTLAYHSINDEVRAGTLAAIIRQSGLSKSIFRQ